MQKRMVYEETETPAGRGNGMKALKCGHLLQEDGSFLEHGILLYENGEIVAAGTGFEIPDGAEVTDYSQAYVSAGLIECHGHLDMMDINEMTSPITPDMRILDALDPRSPFIPFLRNGGFTTHCTLPGSANVIGGEGLTIKLKPAEVIDEIALTESRTLKMAFGENPKMYGKEKKAPGTRMASSALARKTFYSAQKYLEKRMKGELDGIDPVLDPVADALEGTRRVRMHAHKDKDIVNAVRIAEEFHLDYTIEHCTSGRFIVNFLKEHNVRCNIGPLLITPLKLEMEDQDPVNPSFFEKAGIPFALIQDDDWPTIFLPAHVGTCVSQGLSPEAGMRGITSEAAKTLNLDHRIGILKAGYDADISVFSDHPLKNTARCLTTIIDGVTYPHEEAEGGRLVK